MMGVKKGINTLNFKTQLSSLPQKLELQLPILKPDAVPSKLQLYRHSRFSNTMFELRDEQGSIRAQFLKYEAQRT